MSMFHEDSLPTTTFGPVVNIDRTIGVLVESAPLIENVYFDDMAIKALYDSTSLAKWFLENGIEKLDYGGGEFGITANMLADVPKTLIKNIPFPNGKKLGVKRARDIVEASQKAMSTEEYY